MPNAESKPKESLVCIPDELWNSLDTFKCKRCKRQWDKRANVPECAKLITEYLRTRDELKDAEGQLQMADIEAARCNKAHNKSETEFRALLESDGLQMLDGIAYYLHNGKITSYNLNERA
jgi:hypothetical protein